MESVSVSVVLPPSYFPQCPKLVGGACPNNGLCPIYMLHSLLMAVSVSLSL